MILQLLFHDPLLFVIWIVAIVYAITIHEFAHAFAGSLEGDRTAESMGRLTLNPLSHIDPWGFLMLVLVGFGWGRPVPFNPMYLRHKRWGPGLISLAGPVANIGSVLLFGLVHKILVLANALPPENYLFALLQFMIQMNAILALFNLIPIPPLDGSKLLFALLPANARSFRFRLFLEQYGPMLLIGLIIIDSFSSASILGSIFGWIGSFFFTIFS